MFEFRPVVSLPPTMHHCEEPISVFSIPSPWVPAGSWWDAPPSFSWLGRRSHSFLSNEIHFIIGEARGYWKIQLWMIFKATKLWKSFPYFLKAVTMSEVELRRLLLFDTLRLREQSCPRFELSPMKWFRGKSPGLIFLVSGLLACKGLVHSSFTERK